MKFKQIILVGLSSILISGCQSIVNNGVSAPANFVVEQDATDSLAALRKLSGFDHQVIFERYQFVISDSEKARILQWFHTTKPALIGVRGTGGAQRHEQLGNQRAASIVEFLQSQQIVVDAVILDYDASLVGGRGLITVIRDPLAAQVKATAPILIINSN